jgi:hypothetical protein
VVQSVAANVEQGLRLSGDLTGIDARGLLGRLAGQEAGSGPAGRRDGEPAAVGEGG